MIKLSVEELAEWLVRAEKAHAEYEKKLGKRDENWPLFYASWIAGCLNVGACS